MADEIESVTDRLRIFEIRKEAVVLDSDLAAVYGVTTTAFNQAIKRNLDRFPADFSLVLTKDELAVLIITICDIDKPPPRPTLKRWTAIGFNRFKDLK